MFNSTLYDPNQGLQQKFFSDGGSTKKCDHDNDQALIKKQQGSCIEYIYISELMLWLHWGKFVNVK